MKTAQKVNDFTAYEFSQLIGGLDCVSEELIIKRIVNFPNEEKMPDRLLVSVDHGASRALVLIGPLSEHKKDRMIKWCDKVNKACASSFGDTE